MSLRPEDKVTIGCFGLAMMVAAVAAAVAIVRLFSCLSGFHP